MFVCLATIFGCSNKESDLKFMGLNGDVESYMDKKYNAKEKYRDVIKDEKVDEVIEHYFDENGNNVKYIYYSSDGTPFIIIEQKFDKNDVMIESRNYTNDSFETEKSRDNCLTQLINQNNDELTYISFYTSEPNIQDTIYSKRNDKSLTQKRVTRYGVYLDSIFFDNNKVIINKTYDEKDGSLVDLIYFEYKDGLLYKVKNKVPMNPDREEVIYTYEYSKFDNKHNWIEMIERKDDVVTSITERSIKYRN